MIKSSFDYQCCKVNKFFNSNNTGKIFFLRFFISLLYMVYLTIDHTLTSIIYLLWKNSSPLHLSDLIYHFLAPFSTIHCKLPHNFRIRSIHHVVFDALEIYLRRGLGTMSHACTDDRDGDVVFSRRCSPAVTRRVGT